MAATSHLRLIRVDDETGEARPVESQALEHMEAELDKLRGDRKNLERDLRMYRRRCAELERDKVRERLDHPDRAFIKKVCTYWHRRCRAKDYAGSRRINPLSPDRFDAVAALAELQELKVIDGKRVRCWKYGAEFFKAAVDGGEFDPYTPTLKNGKARPQNDLEQIMRSVAKFEAFIEKAPNVAGTFAGGDLEVPLVPGFVRLSPVELARAREEAHTGGREFHTSASPGATSHGGSHGQRAVGCQCHRLLGHGQTQRPVIRVGVAGRVGALPASVV